MDLPYTWEDELPETSSRLSQTERHDRFRRRKNAEKKRLRAIKKQKTAWDAAWDQADAWFTLSRDPPASTPPPTCVREVTIPVSNRFDELEMEVDPPEYEVPEVEYQRWYKKPSARATYLFRKRSRFPLEHELLTHHRSRDGEHLFWTDNAPGWMVGPDNMLWYDDEVHNNFDTTVIPLEHESEEINRLFSDYYFDPEMATDPLLYSIHNAVRVWTNLQICDHTFKDPRNQTYDDILNMDVKEEEMLHRLTIHNTEFAADLHNVGGDVCGNHLSPMRPCLRRLCNRTASCKVCQTCAWCCVCEGSRKRLVRTFRALRQVFPRGDLGYNSQALFNITSKLPDTFTVKHVLEMPFFTALTEALKDTTPNVNWPTVLKELAFCLLHIYQASGSAASIATSLAHFLSNTDVPKGCLNFCMKAVTSYMWNTQSPVDYLPVVGSLGALLIVIIGCKALPSDKSVDQLMQRTGQIGRIISTYDSLEKKLTPLFEQWAEYLRTSLFGYSKRDMDGWKQIDEWCDEVELHRNSHFERRVREDAKLRSTIDTLLQRGNQINKELDATRVPLVARQRITSCMMFLNQARSVAANSTAGLVAPRIPPIVVHFVGASGIGKSSMLGYLNTILLQAVGSTDSNDLHTKIHYRQSTDEYWSDYSTQTEGVVCDDAFSQKDSENNPNPQVQEQIHMANTAHYSLNMANVNDKGMVIFRAKWVIWTTNRHYFTFPSLTNPEAVYNRVTLKFRMKPKPEFAKQKTLQGTNTVVLDHDKLEEALLHDEDADRKCMLFDLIDPTDKVMTIKNDAAHPDGYTFDEMAKMCVIELKKKQAHGKTFLDRQAKFFDKNLKVEDPKKPTFSSLFNETLQTLRNPTGIEAPRATAPPAEDDEDSLSYGGWSWNAQSPVTLDDYDNAGGAGPSSAPQIVPNEDTPLLPKAEIKNPLEEVEVDPFKDQPGWSETLVVPPAADHSVSWTKRQIEKVTTNIDTLLTAPQGNGYNERCEYFSRPNVFTRVSNLLWPNPRNPLPRSDGHNVGGDRAKTRNFNDAVDDIEFRAAGGYHLNLYKTLRNFAKSRTEMPTPQYVMNGSARPGDHCLVLRDPRHAFGVVRLVINLHRLSETKSDPKAYLEQAYKMIPVDRCYCGHQDVYHFDDWETEEWTGLERPTLMRRLMNGAHALFEEWAATIGAFVRVAVTILAAVGAATLTFKGIDWATGDVPKMDQKLAMKNANYAKMHEHTYGKQPCNQVHNKEGYDKTASALPRHNHEGYDKTASALPRHNHESAEKTPTVHYPNNQECNSESLSDQNAAEIRRQLFKNGYLICSKVDAGYKVHGTATFLTGRVFITNRHIWSALEKDFTLSNSQATYTVAKSACAVAIPCENQGGHQYKDVVLVECPRFIPLHSSIKKHFMTKTDFTRHNTLKRVEIVGYDRNGYQLTRGSDLVMGEDRESFQLRDPNGTWYVREHYKYGVETEPGDCGSLAVAFDPAVNRKIIGVHMAGAPAPYTGVASAVHQEFLDSLLAELPLQYPESIHDADVPVEHPLKVEVVNSRLVCTENTFTGFAHAGTVSTRVHAATRTKLRPSPCHGITQAPTKAPARLVPFVNEEGERVSPLNLAMQKATKPCQGVNLEFLADAGKDVRRLLIRNIDTRDQQLLSFEESIAGIPGNPYYTPMNRSAGAGYGWAKIGKGKTHWLGEDEYKFDHPDFVERWNTIHAQIANNKRPLVYWTDTLKDELRSNAKVAAGKTRLFAAGEQVFTAILRKYFMGFCAHVMAHNVDFESCVGMNPLSRDWSRLVDKLSKFGPAVTAGDFTNYDAIQPELLWEVCDIINDFYDDGPENTAARRQLWLEIVNSVHINGNKVYQWALGQPSGCAMTVIINSVVHSIIVRMTFLECAAKYAPEYCSMEAFNFYVSHVNYGDDDVTNISMKIVDWFNQHTQTEMYPRCGMTYTDETKSSDAPRYRKLEEVTFLKRGFRFDKSQARWRAPLSLETIMEMCNWVRGPDSFPLAALELQEAYYELSQHDEHTFDKYSILLDRASRVVDERVRVFRDTYQAYQRLDGHRYGNVATISTPPTSGDRGTGSMTERSGAANPALSDRCPSTGASNSQAGELFSSNGKCVPATEGSQQQRLLAQSNSQGNESSPGSAKRLTSNIFEAITGVGPTAVYASMGSSTNESGPSFAGTDAVQQHQTTTFENDGEIEVGARSVPTRALSSYLRGAQDKLANEISGFLSRPIQIGSFDWLASSGSLGELFAFNLPKQYLTIPMVAEKLRGFRYFRCDFVIEVQVNAQPFNAGALIAWFQPIYGQLTFVPSSAGYLGGVTGYPNVKYRCGDASSFQLRIPYNNILSHFDLINRFGTLGRFAVDVMSPLTGSADVDGTVWIWAENIDFTMPTGLPTLPFTAYNSQAGEDTTTDISEVSEDAMDTATAPIKTERKRRGPVELASTCLSMVSAGLALVPGLQWVAAPAAVVFGAAGKIAHLYGWSKPSDPEYTSLYMPSLVRNTANYQGDSKAKVLALDYQNVTDIPTEVFNTTEDEMAIQTIAKRPIFTDVFTWNSTNPQNSFIWKWPVDPTSCNKRAVTSTTNYVVRFNNYLSYLCGLARFWRGEIVYDLYLVKTPFHSGRIRILWVPGANLSTDPATVDVNKVYSKVYDIRQTTDIRFSVPYTWNAPWKPTNGSVSSTPTDLCYNEPQGMIYVQVINSLRAPTTAASEIETLVFVSAGPDFQLAYPELSPQQHPLSMANDLPTAPASMNAQSGDSIYPSVPCPEFDPNKIAIGEAFLSLRQLMKRYITFNPNPNAYSPVANTVHRNVNYLTNSTGGIGPLFDLVNQPDMWSYIGSLYRFYSGSVRVLKRFPVDTPHTVGYSLRPAAYNDTTTPESGEPQVWFNNNLEPLAEIEVPFYQPWPAIPTALGVPNNAGTTGGVYDRIPFNGGTDLTTTAETEPAMTGTYRQIGESFSFGFLLGPPATVTATP